MNDYERIAAVIRYLDTHATEQPNLKALADSVGLSAFHFHRLFKKWAGVTPKDFLQCLTLAHAKRLLRDGESVLAAALDAGLSGPGRLHDLSLNLEAATPGELKSGGQGWEIRYGVAETPFGECLVGVGPRGICHLAFEDSDAALQSDWPAARFIRDDEAAQRIAVQVFQRTAGPCQLRAFVCGTAFQVRVWRALVRVPAGVLVSYRRLAAAIGQPGAARAVGTAVGQNPLAYLIPCHRVIQ